MTDTKAATDAKPADTATPVADRPPGAAVTDATQADNKPAVAPRTTTDAEVVHEDATVRVEKVGQRFDWYDKTGNAAGPSPDAGTPAARAIVPATGDEPARHETDDEAKASTEAAKDATAGGTAGAAHGPVASAPAA